MTAKTVPKWAARRILPDSIQEQKFLEADSLRRLAMTVIGVVRIREGSSRSRMPVSSASCARRGLI